MDTTFYVLLNLKTPEGLKNFGRFELGGSPESAYTVFSELEGATDVNEKDTLTLELMETKKGLPYNLKIISCTLDQLAYNCRHLTKEIFKQTNLG